MIQFNVNRFGKLVRWTLTNDKRYYVKSFMMMFVMMLLIILFFTLLTKTHQGYDGNYGPCLFAVVAMIIVTVIMGPAYMFYSMEGKHDRQALLMLPASNFEKYLMRYSTWLILLPLFIVAFLAADLLQYAVHWVLGHNYGTLVTSLVAKFGSDMSKTVVPLHEVNSFIVTAVWAHSMYALGSTFFRSRKHNWVLTTLVIILTSMLTVWLTKDGSPMQFDWKVSKVNYTIGSAIYIGWAVLNFWLSYRLFCRTQVIGKLVNV